MYVRSPVGEVRVQPNAGAQPRVDLRGRVVGILNNELGREFSRRLSELLKERYGPADVRYWQKPHHNSPSPQELIAEVAEQVDVAIVGLAA